MRVINQVELAALLYETEIHPEDWSVFYGEEKHSWDELDQGEQDDYLHQARRILERARVAVI